MDELGEDTRGDRCAQKQGPGLTSADADSIMIARAAERNPSVFLPSGPKCTITEVVPKLLNICHYIDNPWGNTKFLLSQFKPSAPPISNMNKQERKEAQDAVMRSKSIEEVAESFKMSLDRGSATLEEIARKIGYQNRIDVFEEHTRVTENEETPNA